MLLLTAVGNVFSQYLEWKQIGPEAGRITCFAAAGDTVYAGGAAGMIYRSTDQGASWAPISIYSSMTRLNGYADMVRMTIHGDVILATTSEDVLISIDGGDRWYMTPVGTERDYSAFFLFMPDLVFIGGRQAMWTDSTFGEYTPTTNQGDFPFYVRAAITIGDTLITGSYNGIYRTHPTKTTRDWTWRPSSRTIFPRSFCTMGSILFAACGDKGVWRSADSGRTWQQAIPTIPGIITDIIADGKKLYAIPENRAEIYISADTAATWTARSLPPATRSAFVHDGIIYAGTDNGIHYRADTAQVWHMVNEGMHGEDIATAYDSKWLYASYNGVVIRSSDYGATWPDTVFSALQLGDATYINQWFVRDGVLIVATGKGVYTSIDTGAHWTTTTLDPVYATCLGVAHGNVYVRYNAQLSRSADGGRTFQTISTDPNIYDANTLLHIGNAIVLPNYEQHIMSISTDDGDTWSNNLLPSEWNSGWLEITETQNNRLQAFEVDKGIMESVDTGRTWFDIRTLQELDPMNNFPLGISRSGKTFLVMTENSIFSCNGDMPFLDDTLGLPVSSSVSSTFLNFLAIDNHLYASVSGRGLFHASTDLLFTSVVAADQTSKPTTSVWPQPASIYVTLGAASQDATLRLASISGSTVDVPCEVTGMSTRVDVSSLTVGVWHGIMHTMTGETKSVRIVVE